MSIHTTPLGDSPAAFAKLSNRLAEIYDVGRAATLLSWDELVIMPHHGRHGRAEQKATLDTIAHRLATLPEIGALLEDLSEWESTLPAHSLEAHVLRLARRNYHAYSAIPLELVANMSVAASSGYHAWVKARSAGDFAHWEPHLQRVTELLREVADAIDSSRSPYEVILQRREPGVTIANLDAMFGAIEAGIIPLRRELLAGPPEQVAVAPRQYDVDGQLQFTELVLKRLGFDFDRGRVDTSVHPVSFSIQPEDVRLCVRTDPTDLRVRLFAAIHEGGHGLYFQNVPTAFRRTPLDSSTAQGAALSPVFGGISTGLHESQSRLWENFLGRSQEFWTALAPTARELFGSVVEDLDAGAWYRGVNEIGDTMIRIEADELSYDLHIMLRYEVERGLLEGKLSVKDAPDYWRERATELFGRPPKDDKEGILQDMHWSRGGHGGFPSYTIGNVVAAQLMRQLRAETPNYDKEIATGNFSILLDWMASRVHANGAAYGPTEVLQHLGCGPDLDASAYVAYLRDKFLPLAVESKR